MHQVAIDTVLELKQSVSFEETEFRNQARELSHPCEVLEKGVGHQYHLFPSLIEAPVV
jgi:hypothetical protein